MRPPVVLLTEEELYRTGLTEPPTVHQAVGFLISQLGVSSAEGLALMRDVAAHLHIELLDVAAEILSGQLHLPAPEEAPARSGHLHVVRPPE
jgi:AmiR/NasT family two-component response regulator